MLAPGDGSDHVQFIDVRDLAQFTRTVIENDFGGAFNLAGPRITWTEFMKILGAQNLIWVAAEIIKSAGVTEFEFPLFRPERGPRSGLMDVSNERARAAGPHDHPEVTVRDMRTWIPGRDRTSIFSPEREAELIRIARQSGILSHEPGS